MRKEAVSKSTTVDAIHGNLSDLFEGYESSDGWRDQNMIRSFDGSNRRSKPPYRIPAADTGTELFFDDLELLARFADMPLPDQEVFCQRVRVVMKEAGVEILHLTVKWSPTDSKVIKI